MLAVSGGADSLALWDLCVRLGRWQLVIWHLDHGLRADAPEDAALLVRQAAAYRAAGLDPGALIIEHADIAALAQISGDGVEAAGRRQRYERLAAVAQSVGATVVCTAHHRDDQAETVLANLLRGAGPIGLMGIARRRRLASGITLVRPLLDVTRAELRRHLDQHRLIWREDASNADLRFQRNRLRRRILPALEALAPGASAALARLAQRTRQVTRADRCAARHLWRPCGNSLRLPEIVAATPAVRRLVFRHLLQHLQAPLERQHLDRLNRLASGALGKRLHLGSWLLRRAPEALVWEEARPVAETSTVTIPAAGVWRRGDQRLTLESRPPPSDPRSEGGCAWLDGAAALPFHWRLPLAGERWRPLGAGGSQTVSKTLAEHGVPSRRRPLTALLADQHGVVWIPGITVAERARVSSTTQSAWWLTVQQA